MMMMTMTMMVVFVVSRTHQFLILAAQPRLVGEARQCAVVVQVLAVLLAICMHVDDVPLHVRLRTQQIGPNCEAHGCMHTRWQCGVR